MTAVRVTRKKALNKVTSPFPSGVQLALRSLYGEIELAIAHSRGARLARAYAGATDLCLHLGCGNNYKADWINIDLGRKADLKLDLRRPLPFTAASCQIIYSEHFLEHVAYPEPAHSLLRECYRVLQPGGILSLAVPDGEMVLKAYVLGGSDAYYEAEARWHPAWCHTPMEHVNHVFRQEGEHHYTYDYETLSAVLADIGFVDVRRRDFDPQLDQAERLVGSLYVVGHKPQ